MEREEERDRKGGGGGKRGKIRDRIKRGERKRGKIRRRIRMVGKGEREARRGKACERGEGGGSVHTPVSCPASRLGHPFFPSLIPPGGLIWGWGAHFEGFRGVGGSFGGTASLPSSLPVFKRMCSFTSTFPPPPPI